MNKMKGSALNKALLQAFNFLSQGLTQHRSGQLEAALVNYAKALKIEPRHFDALHLSGVVAVQRLQYQQAIVFFDQAVSVNKDFALMQRPGITDVRKKKQLSEDYAQVYYNRGIALKQTHQWRLAIDSYEKAIALKADYYEAHNNCGNVYRLFEQWDPAIIHYDRAIVLAPHFAEAHGNRAIALQKKRQWREALAGYDEAIALKPDYAEAYTNRGVALQECDRWLEALANHDEAIRQDPLLAEAHYNRANTQKELKNIPQAIQSYEAALKLKPDYEFVLGLLLYAKRELCDWAEETQALGLLVDRLNEGRKVISGLSLLLLKDDPALQKKAAQIWANDIGLGIESIGVLPSPANPPQITLGYFSADFKNHATTYLMAELFELHDKSRFRLIAFSLGPPIKDAMSDRLKGAFDVFIEARGLSEQEIATLSREHGVDIAIDLKGYTYESQPKIFAFRAAPIQVSYLGYPGTMGADFMDYIIADKVLIPESLQCHYTEKVAYLPHSYQVNDRQRPRSTTRLERQAVGLPQGAFVYCCFNNNFKISPATFDGWMRVLLQVQGSVLWLLETYPTASENLRQAAALRGVAPERLIFASHRPLAEHLSRYELADLFIDTLPYNAHTTASDALWEGLPVLTLMGQSFAARVAASLLYAMDLPELVTQGQDAFEDMAITLASQPQQLQAIRQKLKRFRLASPLFDTPRFTRHLERAYETMFMRYQDHLLPEHFYVPDEPGTCP